MGADARVVGKELGLLEFAGQRAELLRRQRLLQRVVTRREVALRQLAGANQRLARKVEDDIEAFLARRVCAREIDRADGAAGLHAGAVRLALVEVDLVAEVDRLLRACLYAGIAARADLEVDRILLAPFDLEGAEPAAEACDLSRPHRVAALERQLAAAALRDENADILLLRQPLGPVERRRRGTDDEHLAGGLELDRGDRLGLGQRRHGHERRDLRHGLPALVRPASRLAHVHELHVGLRAGASGQLAEERRFLRAGDDDVRVAERRLERGRVPPAELVVHLQRRLQLQRGSERLRVECDRAVAAADLKRLAVEAHRPPFPSSLPSSLRPSLRSSLPPWPVPASAPRTACRTAASSPG